MKTYFEELQSVSLSLSKMSAAHKIFVMKRIGFSPCEINCVNLGIKHRSVIEKRKTTTGARRL